jgi:5,6-dimethylbenzimidazole synthase
MSEARSPDHNSFSEAERDAVYRAIAERRDMRHFRPGAIDAAQLDRLLQAAHQAPSVGLMQPWRIIRISDKALRSQIKQLVEKERQATAKALGKREAEFLKLKVEGIDSCAELLVVSLCDKRDEHVFGRRTMPEMDLASVACAIQNMWLAARVEGLGMGWVSLFEPKSLAKLVALPEGASPVAILCLGQVEAFYSAPMLELENWRKGDALEQVLFENQWGQTAKR